jgi:hypothetical protein
MDFGTFKDFLELPESGADLQDSQEDCAYSLSSTYDSCPNFNSDTPTVPIGNGGCNAPNAPPRPNVASSIGLELFQPQLQPELLQRQSQPRLLPQPHFSPLGFPAPNGYLGVPNHTAFQPTAYSPPGSWPAMAYNAHQQLPLNDLTNVHAYKASSSPEPGDSHGAQGKPHRRGYQACQNCRSRKVKCDLGSK